VRTQFLGSEVTRGNQNCMHVARCVNLTSPELRNIDEQGTEARGSEGMHAARHVESPDPGAQSEASTVAKPESSSRTPWG
jgi:hypothetical protein